MKEGFKDMAWVCAQTHPIPLSTRCGMLTGCPHAPRNQRRHWQGHVLLAAKCLTQVCLSFQGPSPSVTMLEMAEGPCALHRALMRPT